ncbi:alpha/beta hydrolase [Eilatimonas milleporae]|uniref:Pimeloyl-ACP methyl ester carboxylesterase n=1 Tax=Eilatimonas milleporae TaxID=911205 RepID=A0A3M0CUQ1_9PROT|nr:alpha/beta hydrolase [Eilatimonas milleporae]RMB12695.1 pimeloyl-ACP methyl ester carboxylesterase [Eilatimonas milleporae]
MTDQPDFFDHPSGRRLAYHHTPGATPTVVFLGGFMSDMTGSKATTLEEHCRARGQAFLRLDYSGHGASSEKFEDGTIGLWAEDAAAVIDAAVGADGPLVLVGSSMGGWVALLLARRWPLRVRGLVGIAAAPDFTERMWTHELNDDLRATILRDGFVKIPSDYGPDPYIFTRALFDDGRKNSVLTGPLPVAGPVRLLQGMQDADVPWETAVTLAEKVDSPDPALTLIPAGDHRLSTDQDLARLTRTVDEILALLNGQETPSRNNP